MLEAGKGLKKKKKVFIMTALTLEHVTCMLSSLLTQDEGTLFCFLFTHSSSGTYFNHIRQGGMSVYKHNFFVSFPDITSYDIHVEHLNIISRRTLTAATSASATGTTKTEIHILSLTG